MSLSGDLSAYVVYVLCVVSSAACAYLLLQAYRRVRSPVLFWTGMSFLFLTANNMLVAVDLVLFPLTDLLLWRRLTALAAIAVLLYGFLWKLDP
jgi:hypothetical protein